MTGLVLNVPYGTYRVCDHAGPGDYVVDYNVVKTTDAYDYAAIEIYEWQADRAMKAWVGWQELPDVELADRSQDCRADYCGTDWSAIVRPGHPLHAEITAWLMALGMGHYTEPAWARGLERQENAR